MGHEFNGWLKYVLDGFGMPVEWTLSMVVPYFKGNGAIRNYSCYGALKLLDYWNNACGKGVGKGFV